MDGTDFRIPQITPWSKSWYSHKFNAPGLRYEIGVCIHTGAIVWVHGPFPPGDYPDISIFRHALIFMLDNNERVEADDGLKVNTQESARYRILLIVSVQYQCANVSCNDMKQSTSDSKILGVLKESSGTTSSSIRRVFVLLLSLRNLHLTMVNPSFK